MERTDLLAGLLSAWILVCGPAPAAAQCAQWVPGVAAPGTDDAVHALTTWEAGSGPMLIAGGAFRSVVDLAARHVAEWDGQRWAPLGGGVDFPVQALCGFDDGSGPRLFAGGHLPIGSHPQTAAALASWDGVAWTSFGSSLQGPAGAAVRALAVHDDGSGPALYVGGDFTSVETLAVGGIARWNGQAWSQVGGGTNGRVLSLAVYDDGGGPALYAAGDFESAGGVLVHHVARWDGAAWAPLASGVVLLNLIDEVRALEVFDDGGGPALYAGGSFYVPSAGAHDLARWEGQVWSAAGGGMGVGADVRSLAVHDDGSGPALYAGRSTLWKLEGGAWHDLGPTLQPSGMDRLLALESCGSGPLGQPALVVGGNVEVVDPVIAFNCFALEGHRWVSFGAWPQGVAVAVGGDLAVFDDGGGPALYAGGGTQQAGHRFLNQLMRRRDGRWEPVPGSETVLGDETVEALCEHPGSAAIEPGLFLVTSVGSRDLWHFDGSSWSPHGSVPGIGGGEGFVTSMAAFDDGTGSGPSLYVGGELELMPGWSYGVSKWDGTQWTPLTPGSLGIVRALAVIDDGTGPALYIAATDDVLRWDGSALTVVGGGVAGAMALCVHDDGSGPALYAGGDFHHAGGRPALHVARWDGSAWSGVGSGLSSDAGWFTVGGLGVFDDGSGPVLVAAGDFQAAGGVGAENIAAWDGQAWSALGQGLGDSSWSKDVVQHDEEGVRTLWVRGAFTTVGAFASWGIAGWRDACSEQPVVYCAAKPSPLGCTPSVRWSGTPSAVVPTPFWIAARGVDANRTGLLFYGLDGQAAAPFLGGTLCVAPPLRRTPPQSSGGSPPPDDCSGAFALDFNAWIQGGNDPGLVAGVQVRAQHWYRDPASSAGSGLSDAIAFAVGP